MSDVAALIADLVRAGVDPDLIGRTAAALASREPVKIVDEQAERKRAADRERMRRKRVEANSRAMSRDVADLPSPKKEIPPTPPKEKTTPSLVSEPIGSSTNSPEPEKSAPDAIIGLPTVSDGDYPIFANDIAEWSSAYPAVDVRQQLAAMRQWLIANPKRRKTRRGMRTFVVSWLDRRQNAGTAQHQPRPSSASPPHPPPQRTMNDAINDLIAGKLDVSIIPRQNSDDSGDRCGGSDVIQRNASTARH